MNEIQSGNKICNACSRENETESAESWCVNCSEALCKQCIRFHRRNKITADHKFTALDDGEMSLSGADIFCSEHRDKKLEVYCSDHNTVCCMSCIMLKHRKCDNISSVEEAAESLKTSNNAANIEKSLTETKEVLETLVQSRTEYMKKKKTAFSDMKEDVEKLFRELTNHLEQLKSKSLLEVAAIDKEIISDLENERDDLQCKIATLENDLALYHSHMKNASPAQFLQAMDRLSGQSAFLKQFVRSQLQELKEVEVLFERNKTLTDIPQAVKLGEVKVNKSRLKQVGQLSKEWIDMLNVTPKLLMQNDVNDLVLGSAILNDNLILISKFDGGCLELWDSQCTLLSSLSFSAKSRGIKMVSDTEGMITVEHNLLSFKIQDRKIIETNNIIVPSYHGDVILHNGRYVLGGKDKIIVLDMYHHHLRDIAVLGTVEYLVVRDNTSLCYTINDGRKLYCITLDGTPVFTYSNDNLSGTSGVTVDNAGYIYVCGYHSRNVHQLSHDGTIQRRIFDNLPASPCSICFNKCGDIKAVIGCHRKVLVYDLE